MTTNLPEEWSQRAPPVVEVELVFARPVLEPGREREVRGLKGRRVSADEQGILLEVDLGARVEKRWIPWSAVAWLVISAE